MSAKLKIQTAKGIAIHIHNAVGFAVPPFVRKEDSPRRIAEIDNELFVGVESLKTWLTERLEISQKYTTALDPQARRQARIEVDVYSRILSELEEAKQR